MAHNNLNTMYGGGFARIMDSNNKVYRLVNVINAKAMFESQTDSLRAVFPNSPSQVIATATTQLNCTLTATLAEFNAEQFSLASNLVADTPGEDASMPVINERHVCLSNQIIPNYLPKAGKAINVYSLRKGREYKLEKVVASTVKIGNAVIKAGYMKDVEIIEDVAFDLPISDSDFSTLMTKLSCSVGANNVVTFSSQASGEEIELLVVINNTAFPVIFTATPTKVDPVTHQVLAPSTVDPVKKTIKVIPKFSMAGVNNNISYNVWAWDNTQNAAVNLGSFKSYDSATMTIKLDLPSSVTINDGWELLVVDSKDPDPNATSFTSSSKKNIFLDSVNPTTTLAAGTNVSLPLTNTSAGVSVVPVADDNVKVNAKNGMFLYASQFVYELPVNGQGNGVITVSDTYIGQGVSVDYERNLAGGTYWMMGGSNFKQMGYVDFYLTLQTQQGTWIFYRFPAAWPNGKYELDMQGSFMNLPIEFTCVALPGYNLPYIAYGEIQQ